MTFRKHATRRTVNGFRYARYTSIDGRFAVEKSTWTGRAAIPVVYRALKRIDVGWVIISPHRTRRAAERAAERVCKKEDRRVPTPMC